MSVDQWVRESAVSRVIGRAYVGVQGVAGALWWLGVFLLPGVREATLGCIAPVPMAVADVPLFVFTSLLVACGVRAAVWVLVPWCVLVTVGVVTYATLTQSAGWGAVIMCVATLGSFLAALLIRFGRIPADQILRGPLRLQPARPSTPAAQLRTTLLQMLGFWVLFLGVLPAVILRCETRWGVGLSALVTPELGNARGDAVRVATGLVVLAAASALGIWAAIAMSLRGEGTPLPSASTNRLVIAGPYRWVRNPMALAGIVQAVGVGVALGSWLVVLYACCGALYWNALVRPYEEADLEARFAAQFTAYRERVRCWLPRIPNRS